MASEEVEKAKAIYASLKQNKTKTTPEAIKTPVVDTLAPQAGLPTREDSTSRKEEDKSGFFAPISGARDIISMLNRTSGDEAQARMEPEYVPQLSGLKYLKRDASDINRLKKLIEDSAYHGADQTSIRKQLELATDRDFTKNYQPPETTADTAKKLENLIKLRQGTNKEFTDAQVRLLNAFVTPPQRIIQELSGHKEGIGRPGSAKGPGDKSVPPGLAKEVRANNSIKAGISGIEKLLGKPLEQVDSLPGIFPGSDTAYAARNVMQAVGMPESITPGSEIGKEMRAYASKLASEEIHKNYGTAFSANEQKLATAYMGSNKDDKATIIFLRRMKEEAIRKEQENNKMYPEFKNRISSEGGLS